MATITEFLLFPQLPEDIRTMIYLLISPTVARIVDVQEHLTIPPFSHGDHRKLNDKDYIPYALHPYQILHNTYSHHFPSTSYAGQSQLEDHFFTSTNRKPVLPTKHEILTRSRSKWEEIRLSSLRSSNPILKTLHICKESRLLTIRQGYVMAFSMGTAPAMTWFSYRLDILYIDPPTASQCRERPSVNSQY